MDMNRSLKIALLTSSLFFVILLSSFPIFARGGGGGGGDYSSGGSSSNSPSYQHGSCSSSVPVQTEQDCITSRHMGTGFSYLLL